MAGGRPRTVSPSPAECIKLGQDMVKWVELNHPTHLSEWFSIEMMIPWRVWDIMIETPEFYPYYDVAISHVARNCRNGTLDKSLAQRFLSMYHRDLRRFELKVKEEEAALSAGKVEADAAVVANTMEVLAQITKVQKSKVKAQLKGEMEAAKAKTAKPT